MFMAKAIVNFVIISPRLVQVASWHVKQKSQKEFSTFCYKLAQ
jgi:hypothetical protein